MMPLTKLPVYLTFCLFIFYMAEQHVILIKQTNWYALQSHVSDPTDTDNLIADDTEVNNEDALNSFSTSFKPYTVAHKIFIAERHRSFISVNVEHWHPPKQA